MSIVVLIDASVSIDPIPADAKGIVRGATITVKGTAQCVVETKDSKHPDNDTSENSPEAISEVAVRLGPKGLFETAKPTGPVSQMTNQKTWTTWTTDPLTITGFERDENGKDKLEITARVSASAGAGPLAVEDQKARTVTVILNRTPPDLRVTTGPEMTKAVVNGQTTFTLKGTAEDPDNLSPVVAVEWVLG